MIGVGTPGGRLGLMSMSHCWSNRADKGGPNVQKLVMQRPKDRHREDVEQDTGDEWCVMGVCRKRQIRIHVYA